MRRITMSLAALLLVAGCKQATPPEAAAAASADSTASLNREALEDPRRLIDLQGGVNFRDLGGYRTENGKMVKWQTVYRSGTPGGLTEADLGKLAKLGIRTVCDFRSNEERAHEPNPYVAGNPDVTYWTRDYANVSGSGDLAKVLFAEDASPEKTRASMIQLYRQLPESQADSYAQMFRFLAEGKVPLAFNCTAGKDRAGTGAALVLILLGVPRETVLADYALSDKLVDYKAQIAKSTTGNTAYAALAKAPFEIVEPLMKSDPAYLSAALDALTEEYGSIDGFIEKRLGVTPAMREQIRNNLLTASHG